MTRHPGDCPWFEYSSSSRRRLTPRSAAWLARLALALAACWLWAAGLVAAERSSGYQAALDSISIADMQAVVGYLAHDGLEGREAGSRGGRLAGDFLQSRLARLHYQPAGEAGQLAQPFAPNFRNFLALLEGSDADLKREVIVLGAHYDHIGYGTPKNSRGPVGLIHHGADDNASGTAAVLEIAQAFAMLPEPPRRSILFAFWDGEEKGLLGSKNWIAHPTLSLDRVVMMINVDMVGRLREDRLTVIGVRTSAGLRRTVVGQNDGGLSLDFPNYLRRDADYFPFLEHALPVLMLHTGLHEDYHRPSDEAAKINTTGMARIDRLLFGTLYDMANRQAKPVFRLASRTEAQQTQLDDSNSSPSLADRLGAAWDRQPTPTAGVRLSSVVFGGPASQAKLLPGDRILKLGGREIYTSDDLSGAVMAAENPCAVTVQRAGTAKPQELAVQLTGKPLRLGIMWRDDEAEPGTVVLTQVVPGSPAAESGLRVGDRVYQIGGRDFQSDTEFAELARTLASPVKLLIERDGKLQTVELHLETVPIRRAA